MIQISPTEPVAGEEIRFEVSTTDSRLYPPQVEYLDFGDGYAVHCTYRLSSGGSEECRVYYADEGRTQYCYHTYKQPGRYVIKVKGSPGGRSTAEGSAVIEVAAARSTPLLPSQGPRPRDC